VLIDNLILLSHLDPCTGSTKYTYLFKHLVTLPATISSVLQFIKRTAHSLSALAQNDVLRNSLIAYTSPYFACCSAMAPRYG
jgi:hypothetical protein